MKISVIICSHNPKPTNLGRALDALRGQTLGTDDWELVLIDNASRDPLSEDWDLEWHPRGRHVREETLGLTAARLRGIAEARGEILVFVDDDNVLDANFLEVAWKLAQEHPRLGAFGGSLRGEFEEEPPEEMTFVLRDLAVRIVEKESWCLHPGVHARYSTPCGGGMVIRTKIARIYARNVRGNSLRIKLDRSGDLLTSGGDIDMAYFCHPCGFGVGQFPDLGLTHLIPPGRFDKDYVLRMTEGSSYSRAIVNFLWHQEIPAALPESSRIDRWVDHYKSFRQKVRRDVIPYRHRIIEKIRKGTQMARSELLKLSPEERLELTTIQVGSETSSDLRRPH